jgi:hypothetical protein
MITTLSPTSTAVAAAEPVFTGPEQLALAGFLAGAARRAGRRLVPSAVLSGNLLFGWPGSG